MSSFHLFLALLSLFLHACHGGRQIGGSVPSLHSSKDVSSVEIAETSLGEKNPVQEMEASAKRGENQEAIQGAVDIVSLVKVSWKLPNKKDEAHTGYNLDYYQPRTHPPSHN